jgi:ATP-dependent Clp protease ATP-binding subunit ClpA
VKAHVDDLTDSLIGHFVDQSRRAGRSWSEIGTAMGVSKQAAQQRHTSEKPWRVGRGAGPMFARFTPRARTAVREGDDAAKELRHAYVGTEHLLLGLLAVSQGIAGKSLTSMGVTRDAVVAKLEAGSGPDQRGGRGRGKHTPFTPLAEQALEGALDQALTLNHNYIGTEHILLALFGVPDGLAAKILAELGVTAERARADVIQRLTSFT